MKDSVIDGGDITKPPSCNNGGSGSHGVTKRVMKMSAFFVGFTVLWILLYNSASPFDLPVISHYLTANMPAVSKVLYLPPLSHIYNLKCSFLALLISA